MVQPPFSMVLIRNIIGSIRQGNSAKNYKKIHNNIEQSVSGEFLRHLVPFPKPRQNDT
jgi:hypothetical protein